MHPRRFPVTSPPHDALPVCQQPLRVAREALAPSLRSLQYLRAQRQPLGVRLPGRARPGPGCSSSAAPRQSCPAACLRAWPAATSAWPPRSGGLRQASRPAPPIWTGGPADEEPLGLPKCCQPDAVDKASVLEPGRPAGRQRPRGTSPTSGDSAPGNRSGPRHINDSPFGTLLGSGGAS